MKCLVTGGAGFIGSHLVRGLLKQGHEVRVFDNFSTGSQANIDKLPIEILEGDVRDYGRVQIAVSDMQVIFHLAALASVARSVGDPLASHAVNATGTLSVLHAAHKAGVRRVVYASSSSVYGNSLTLPKQEDATPAPASPYAITKLTGEHYCQVFWNTFKLETVCLRYFNVFGPRQSPYSEYAAVIPRFIDAAMHGGSPTIYGDGSQSRDFTYVENVVAATLLAGTTARAAGQIMNVACGERRSLLDLISLLETVIQSHITPVFEAPRVGDIQHSQASIERARRVLGYRPQTGFEAGLHQTAEWFREIDTTVAPLSAQKKPGLGTPAVH